MATLSLEAERNADRGVIGADVRHVLRDFIARRVGDLHTAEDLTQEVLVKAYRSGADVDNVAAWLYRIARNTVVDHFRSQGRHPAPEALTDDELDAAEPGDDDPRAVRELAQCLRPLIDQLAPIYREALTLTDLDGLTQSEAARRISISTSGMKSRVQRGRAQLKTALLQCCVVRTDVGGRISGYTPRPDRCDCTSTT
jgi:RNA polymerase sigma-70 factor (ECF subfamily)